ncbi:MAG: GNAT family N-acetyltransferase [Acidobacteriota bacterium]
MVPLYTTRDLVEPDAAVFGAWLSESEPWRTLGYAAEAWPAYFETLARDRSRKVYVLTRAASAVGLAVVRRHVLLGEYLELFAIAPGERRRGAGKTLLDLVEMSVFGRTSNLYLCVSDFNADGRAFYEAAGYREVGCLDALVVSGRAEILMRKTTGPARRASP